MASGCFSFRRRKVRPSFAERQGAEILAVEKQHVEHVVVGLAQAAPRPRGFTVEDDGRDRELRDGFGGGGVVGGERQLVPRPQLDLLAVLVGQHADAVEFALEGPRRVLEPLVGERRRHGRNPVRKPSRPPLEVIIGCSRHASGVNST
jgi:hypothetical protein